ncbi:MFS transporter [Sphingopyxis sp. USTB-05]|uniref:MFS transporter n=1 Tax=Sphingopyxis sp. USTB-05 TaxID=2830667 RepID=UPI00207854E2|nr:MFS transporter [Sphingopyxis sp. USTB-05]USI77595.1 MFS transporter [Sphingopyxis sp. USTB-05]
MLIKLPTRQHMYLATNSVAADLTYFVLPLILGAMVVRHGVSELQGGILATIQVMSTALLGCLLFPIAPRILSKWTLYAGLMLLLVSNLGTIFAHRMSELVVLRTMAGIGEGIVIVVVSLLIGKDEGVEEGFAVQAFGVGLGSTAVSLIAPMLIPRLGEDAIFVVLGLLPLLAISMVPRIHFPAAPADASEPDRPAGVAAWTLLRQPMIALMLISFFCMVVASNATFVFFERTATSLGMSFTQVLYVMTLSNLSMLLGPVFAHWAGVRFGRLNPLLLSYAAIGSGALLIGYATSPASLIAGLMLQGVAVMLVKPYMNGLCVAADPSGRFVTLNFGAYALGSGVTPALSALVLSAGFGFTGLADFSMALIILASIAVIWAIRGSSVDVASEKREKIATDVQ